MKCEPYIILNTYLNVFLKNNYQDYLFQVKQHINFLVVSSQILYKRSFERGKVESSLRRYALLYESDINVFYLFSNLII